MPTLNSTCGPAVGAPQKMASAPATGSADEGPRNDPQKSASPGGRMTFEIETSGRSRDASKERRMEASSFDLTGGCSCGEVRYRLRSAPMFVHCCHCRDCQRLTGSAFVVNALIGTDRMAVERGVPQPTEGPTARREAARHLSLSYVPHRAMERLRTASGAPLRAGRNAR